MRSLKNFLNMIMAGGVIGAVLFAWFSPGLISWYYTPPAELVFSCSSTMNWTLDAYRKVMFVGLLMGVIISSILFFAFSKKRSAQPVPSNAPKGTSE